MDSRWSNTLDMAFAATPIASLSIPSVYTVDEIVVKIQKIVHSKIMVYRDNI